MLQQTFFQKFFLMIFSGFVAADQAKVIAFLASSDADFVTGLTIDVTGGL